ncbi:hypothetical protein JEP92_09020 [Serratia surfactantfaciens]|uniref:YtcA family lipoprotein n=1 Tax=Serratia surfactantfaciens TaxID=2741499 RepID=UPI0018E486AE|nr:hypothetical protein [Serratia surfactantfaciens]
MKKKLFLICGSSILLSSCSSHSPSINILGAYFPDWMFCISGGCISVVIIYAFLNSLRKEMWLSPYILTYPLLTTLFSISYWVVFFN